MKRVLDILFSLAGLVLLGPVIVVFWVVSSIDTRSNGIFVQKRVGKDGVIFSLYKIKTMYDLEGKCSTVTSVCDPRITKSGKIIRKLKLDELPQLLNVLVGDMSFVGPRPDVPGYADKLIGDEQIVISVRPGITGPAQIAYRNEEELLAKYSDPCDYNDSIIWPNKVRINVEYVKNQSLYKDACYVWKTLFR